MKSYQEELKFRILAATGTTPDKALMTNPEFDKWIEFLIGVERKKIPKMQLIAFTYLFHCFEPDAASQKVAEALNIYRKPSTLLRNATRAAEKKVRIVAESIIDKEQKGEQWRKFQKNPKEQEGSQKKNPKSLKKS